MATTIQKSISSQKVFKKELKDLGEYIHLYLSDWMDEESIKNPKKKLLSAELFDTWVKLKNAANNQESFEDFFCSAMDACYRYAKITEDNLCRMNMILHDVNYRNFNIKQEDTLERPQHEGMRFEAVVANPPFSAQWSSNQLFMSDDRFSQYGKLAPSSKADFAFVQHMIHHLDDNGQMAVVLPHGALFRGGAEGHIRRYLIEDKNFLDAVIGLPANIFYGTSIPTCILVFKKCRENPESILFIDASAHFEKVKNQNKLRVEDIDKIISTYKARKNEAKYSHVASLQEIAENDYNLNIPRYVDTFEAEDSIDLNAVSARLKELESEMKQTNATIADYCKQLGIATPF